MGNETSTVEEIPGVRLQIQDVDNLWTIVHQEEGEEEEGAGEGQEVCLFTRVPGKGDQAELCKLGVNVCSLYMEDSLCLETMPPPPPPLPSLSSVASSYLETMPLSLSPPQHLRVLRHPNILKFLKCDLTPDYIVMITEPVVPLCRVLEGLCVEGMVIGWRELAQGLIFLHSKVTNQWDYSSQVTMVPCVAVGHLLKTRAFEPTAQ